MSDQHFSQSENKFDELSQLILDAVKTEQLDITELHELVIKAWHISIDRGLDHPVHRVIIKNGASLFNMLYRTIYMYHCDRAFVLANRPNYAKTGRLPVQPIDLNIRFSPWHIVADLKDPLNSPDEIELSFSSKNIEIELQQYPPDALNWIRLAAQSWLYLYEQLIEERKVNNGKRNRSRGRNYYIDKVLESEQPHEIKTLLQAGRCIGCGGERQNKDENYSSVRYCTRKCSNRLDNFFRDWMAGKLNKFPLAATIEQSEKVLRDKYSLRYCKVCECRLDNESSKGDNVHCPNCRRALNVLKTQKRKGSKIRK